MFGAEDDRQSPQQEEVKESESASDTEAGTRQMDSLKPGVLYTKPSGQIDRSASEGLLEWFTSQTIVWLFVSIN